jgi:dipeptidyl aminopeptidase/acylaminoacyl peptidase
MLKLIILIFLTFVSIGCTDRQEVTFKNGDVTLAGTLTMPSGNNSHPAVIFVHGSGAVSRESNRFYADLFARHGIATLIYDKRGVGASTGDWRYMHLEDLAEDALAGVQLLKSRKDINPHEIGIFGGSQGGWVAPLAASRSKDVAFVITSAGSTFTPIHLAKWRSTTYVRNAGYSDEIVQRASALMDLQFDLIRREGWIKGWEKYEAELQKVRNEPWFSMLSELRNPRKDYWFMAFTASIDFDPIPVYENLNVPVLAILGEADVLVPARETAALLERTKKEKNKDITIAILSGADHNMNRPTGARPVPEYAEIMIGWILRKVNV